MPRRKPRPGQTGFPFAPLPIREDRTPEQLKRDGDHKWPDGTKYVPPNAHTPAPTPVPDQGAEGSSVGYTGRSMLDFTDPATLPYAPGSESSKATAKAAAERAPSHRKRIYLHLKSLLPAGATAPEIEEALKLHRSTVSSRMGELERVNYVKRIGEYRPTPSGNPAEVYVAVPHPEDDPPRPPAKDDPQYVTMEEQDHNRLVKEANDCRLALAAFMAGYGNCNIPGALMDLAHKPEVPPGLTVHDACEFAMMQAWLKGVKALGLQFRDPPITPNREG